MKKIQKNSKGITLIALIITIIILLILAGISIAAITQTGLFSRAKQAEQLSKEKQEEENAILETYENEIGKYLGESKKVEGKIADRVKDGTIKIGDYVKYAPDIVTNTDKSYTDLLSNLTTYSGNTDNTKNTTSTLTQEINLNWRVLDITDDGQVRLISELPTTSKLTLNGYNGYNNAVKLIDDTCSTLYTNSKLASKVQNLKIEDIQDKMVEKDYTKITPKYGKKFTSSRKFYPNIILKEKEQTVTIGSNTTTGTEVDLSEQKELINQTEKNSATSLNLKYTYWYKEMIENDFLDAIYYKLFINNNQKSNEENIYPNYWMSSRCISSYDSDTGADFIIRCITSGGAYAFYLATSGGTQKPYDAAFRPVITLNSNVQIDTENSGDGSTAAQGYAIK